MKYYLNVLIWSVKILKYTINHHKFSFLYFSSHKIRYYYHFILFILFFHFSLKLFIYNIYSISNINSY